MRDGTIDSDGQPVWYAGELRINDSFVDTIYGNQQTYFRHTKIEEDLKLRPDWAG